MIFRIVWIACLAVLSVSAGTIVDVSSQTMQQLNPGDTLYFQISDLSLHSDLTSVEFQFITQPIDPSTQFEAELTSRDGSIVLDFPALQIIPGVFVSARYNGAISSVFGTVELPGTLSEEIFQDTRATLVLRNDGPPVTVGLPGNLLPQDLAMALSSGSISMGIFTTGVLYEDPPPVPEGNSLTLVALGVSLLLVFSAALRQIRTTGSEFAAESKSCVCNPVGTSDTI